MSEIIVTTKTLLRKATEEAVQPLVTKMWEAVEVAAKAVALANERTLVVDVVQLENIGLKAAIWALLGELESRGLDGLLTMPNLKKVLKGPAKR